MTKGRDHRRGTQKRPGGGPRRGRGDRRRRTDRGPPSRRRPPTTRREMVVRGMAGDLGLDGMLRIALDPIDLQTAELLHAGRRAEAMTNRGLSIGRLETIVGTLQRPVAIVRLYADARGEADRLSGRELFLG